MEKKEIQLAKLFHDTYERLAPEFGYTTREDTKGFNKNSPNGKLMVAVCKEVMTQELDKAREEERKKVGKEIVNLFIGINKWMSIQPGLKLEAVTDKVLGDYVSNLLKTKEDEK